MSDRLNLIRQFNAFNVKRIGRLKPTAVALYFTLLDIANRASFDGGVIPSFHVDNERLLKLSGIANLRTLRLHRNELVNAGFISYHKGARGQPSLYRLFKLY